MSQDKNKLPPLISNKISEIGNLLFNLNRLLDAGMDWLDIDCLMAKTSEHIHNIAHEAPIDADSFRDFNAKNGMRTDYSVPVEGSKALYENILEFYIHAFSYVAKILDAMAKTSIMADELGEVETVEFLNSQFPKIVSYRDRFANLCNATSKAIDEGKSYFEIDNIVDDI